MLSMLKAMAINAVMPKTTTEMRLLVVLEEIRSCTMFNDVDPVVKRCTDDGVRGRR